MSHDVKITEVRPTGFTVPVTIAVPTLPPMEGNSSRIKELELALRISEKRCEMALNFFDVSLFEYNVLADEIILLGKEAQSLGMPTGVKNGVDALARSGFIAPENVNAFREMYCEIINGAPTAHCVINVTDLDGVTFDFELDLANVYDDDGRPVWAVGVKRNVTRIHSLQRERQYNASLASNQMFIYEVNITRDKIIKLNESWARPLGISHVNSYTQLKNIVRDTSIAPEFRESLYTQMSSEALCDAYERGERLMHTDYRKRTPNNEWRWFRKNVNIIKDQFNGDIIIRCHTVDINELKLKEFKQQENLAIYEALISKSTCIYEFNFTQNLFISGHERWPELFGTTPTDNYTDMMNFITSSVIHPEDRAAYGRCISCRNVLDFYNDGHDTMVFEYRRPNEAGDYLWMRCTMRLYTEPGTGDVKGRAYIEDINVEKVRELELIYNSEHDQLTTLLNKGTVERHITDYLHTSEARSGIQAFFIIDIDYFKSVNDTFGHAFGDIVLSQIAYKIRSLFRDVDILGRVGGDEFIVLMKNISTRQSALDKAQEVCDKLGDRFVKNGSHYNLTVSVGIAVYDDHDDSYDQLYRHSDTALYAAKENGRNQFRLYNENMGLIFTNVKAIDENELMESRAFEDNVGHYVFKLLYESADKLSAINSVLELISKHYNVNRSYIFEETSDKLRLNNTFEWCDSKTPPYIDTLQGIPYESLGDYKKNFNADGIFYLPDITEATPRLQSTFKLQDIKSMLQFSILKSGVFCGFIGFDLCYGIRIPTKKEMSTLQNVANILAVFVVEMRTAHINLATQNISMSIINGLDSYAYVCDPDTHRILFANTRTNEIAPHIIVGTLCYESIWRKSAPCEACPMANMIKNQTPRHTMDLYNTALKIWIRATSSYINWIHGERVCLIDSVDITEYIK